MSIRCKLGFHDWEKYEFWDCNDIRKVLEDHFRRPISAAWVFGEIYRTGASNKVCIRCEKQRLDLTETIDELIRKYRKYSAKQKRIEEVVNKIPKLEKE